MITLAILALVASVLVWASPSLQAQANQAPFADAGTDQTVNPGADVTLTGAGSIDVDGGTTGDCGGCTYEWEVETGPYDWISIGEADGTPVDVDTTPGAFFEVPAEAFVEKVSDNDPQKYEIVVRLTVTDDDGATDSDTVSININQRPVADIQVYAGLRDKDITDGDLGAMGHFPVDAVIDGPGENGNRDNEWDIMEGAYLQLSGAGSTDENPRTGTPSSYQWTRVRPTTLANYADSQSGASATGQRLTVATGSSGDPNEVIINFGDLDGDGTENEDAADGQIAERLVVYTLPDVQPNAPQTVFYQLTVCDSTPAVTSDITTAANCTGGRTGATLIRLVVHDTSATPEVSIGAALTSASSNRGDAEPQETVGQITGVENQFIVATGSSVELTATVKDDDQTSGHVHRWSGATPGTDSSKAVVRVPADAEDGDTIDVSVTTIDATRIVVTTPIQLLVGENTKPTASGVPTNGNGIPGAIGRSSYTDGIQNRKDGATVTLRGVGNDADGDALIHAWVQREAPADFGTTMNTALAGLAAAAGDPTAIGTALAPVVAVLQNLKEPARPLFELNGAFTDTVSFDVPELKNGETKGTILIFTVIDSNGVSDSQLVYIEVTGDDDVPNADAGADEQVDPGAFVRLNGSGSSDPDVGDTVTHSWEFVGATMDPAPDERSPLSADEIDELEGWILEKDATATGGFTYIVNSAGNLIEGKSSDKLQGGTTAYPYFDAPDLSGFNNIKLTFRLTVTDSADDTRFEVNGNLIDPATGEAYDPTGTDPEDPAAAETDTDTVTITVVNRYYSGDIPGPDYCYGKSLGGPQTYPFDDDKDGVADTCSLNTTRRATVARQNALETLANLNPVEFRDAVNAVCGAPGFKQRNYGDDPDDLASDVCETRRVTPPPAGADPATAEEFFSGVISGPDFCTNHSLGGARTYAYDSPDDEDGVADICSLSTTRREAIARQQALEGFIESFSAAEQTRHDELAELLELRGVASPTAEQTARLNALNEKYAEEFDEDGGTDGTVDDGDEADAVQAEVDRLAGKSADATRYSNAVDAACRALGSQDFGDAASALARDACAPKSGPTGQPLS